MKDSKDHLNIDLDFLDKKEPIRVAPKPEPEPQKSESATSGNAKKPEKKPIEVTTNTTYNWKKILIVGGIIVFFLWAIFSGSSDDSSSSSTTSNSTYSDTSSGNTFTDDSGQTFRCSDYNYDRAMALKPSATESAALDARVSASNSAKDDIESMYVDEYDQDSIDSYNEAVDDFNFRNNRLKADLAAWDTKVDTYNSYLDDHCTPQ
ncbi:MAG: hypothetical protein KA052_00410 [Candidatus Pacebacteria bacterium]|nr:hypothetical protein [Candidatus Paceibacterota bacterium]